MQIALTISAEAVAWYAAIVSTASLLVSAWSAWRDRARLVITARSGYHLQNPPPGYSEEKIYLTVSVANRGRRPVTIQKVWLTQKDSKRKSGLLLHDSIRQGSAELAEGKKVDYLLDQAGLDLDTLRGVVAEDLTGRLWKGRVETSGT